MPLHVKSISIRFAVTCLFIISFVGWFSRLDPFTCCKRALIGAAAAYIVTSIAVKIINDILISVLVKSQMERQKGDVNGR